MSEDEWAARNVPGYMSPVATSTTTTTSVPSNDDEGALPKRPRLEEDDFDPASATPAKELDYSEVPADDELGGFNAFFYFFKCMDPTNRSKALFIKHNEIPLLLKKGLDEKCYILYSTYDNIWRLNTTKGVYAAMEKDKIILLQYTKDSEKQIDVSENVTLKRYRKADSQAKLSWEGIGYSKSNFEMIDAKFNKDRTMFHAVLYYLAVKYPDKCRHKDAYSLIAQAFLYINVSRNKTYYEKNIPRMQEEVLELEQKLQRVKNRQQRMLLERFSMPLSAKMAYAKGAHPEDTDIKASAEEAALSKVYTQ